MVTIDNLVTQGSVMPDNLRSDTARATLEYKNQLKNAGDIYVGTGTKITNDEAGVEREIYVTEGTNIQTALNEDIFRVGGKNNIGLTNSDLSAHSNNIGIGKDISVNSDNNILIGNSTLNSGTNSAIIIGGGSITDNSSITIGNNAKSIGPDAQMITIGNNAENNGYRGVAIGYNAKVNAANAAQIGSGTNSVANSLKFRDTEIVDGSGNVNATKINKVLSTDIFEDDGKMVKNATLAQNIVDGAVTRSSLNKPQQLVSHSIYIKASDYSMEVAIPCVNNSSSYGNNFLNFCNDYKSGSVVYAENLTAGGCLNRETDGGLFVNITQAMKMEKISAGQVFKYKIDFAGVRYNSEKNRMEGSILSLYIRNGDDGTKAYKYIEPTSGEPVYTIRDLAYSITGIENI